MNNRGYILITMMFMMLLMAVTVVGMNRRAGMQARMVSNQARSVQIYFGQLAAIEHARWSILRNPAWRTDPGGEDYIFEGVIYNRLVEDCTVTGYEDAVTVAVTAPGGLNPMKVHFRWQLVERSKPITMLYIADKSNNRIRKVDGDTGIITTVAGTGSAGYNGDNQPATSAQLSWPNGLFTDASGNIYIADYWNNRIRKVDGATGIISLVAGKGMTGFQGDGGLATQARLNHPIGVFVNAYGDVYIADTDNHCIRKVDGATGIITTVAGIGQSSGYSGDGGPATSAKLNNPDSVFEQTIYLSLPPSWGFAAVQGL